MKKIIIIFLLLLLPAARMMAQQSDQGWRDCINACVNDAFDEFEAALDQQTADQTVCDDTENSALNDYDNSESQDIGQYMDIVNAWNDCSAAATSAATDSINSAYADEASCESDCGPEPGT